MLGQDVGHLDDWKSPETNSAEPGSFTGTFSPSLVSEDDFLFTNEPVWIQWNMFCKFPLSHEM